MPVDIISPAKKNFCTSLINSPFIYFGHARSLEPTRKDLHVRSRTPFKASLRLLSSALTFPIDRVLGTRRDTSNETLSTNLVESAFLLLSAWRIVHVRSRDPYSEYWLPRSTLVLPVAVDGAAMQNELPPVAAAANATTVELSRWERVSSRFHMRPAEDDEPQSWWIASTAIPLVAAATGPLANVMSIVALVMPWRNTIISRDKGPTGTWVQEGYNDPHW